MTTSENPSFALLFPGQGSQRVGMGYELSENSAVAKAIFEQANDILGYSISKVCFDDPHYKLSGTNADTSIIQPALLTVEYATFRHLKSEGMPDATIFSGHSLGKISALVAAESLDFESALHLVAQRGEIMRKAKEDFKTIVILISGLEEEKASRLLDELGEQASSFEVTIINSAQQLLIGGLSEQWHKIVAPHFQTQGVRARPYPDAPLSHHSILLKPQQSFNLIVSRLRENIRDASVPILDDISTRMLKSAEEIETSISTHLIDPLTWSRNVLKMKELGITLAAEIGPGTVLKGLARGYPDLKVYPTEAWGDIRVFANLFK